MPETRIDEALLAQPGRLLALGCALMESGKGEQAVALVEASLARRPNDPMLREAAEAILSYKVPAFHREMLADAARSRAYRRAIEAAAPAGKTVLDVGAGSGLLAMMAARAGAARVYACEANGALAATAGEIVAANSLAERVRILARHSSTLDAAGDLDGGVDLVVSELFSHELIGEGALSALSHAMTALVKPGARIVPAGAAIRVALAHFGRCPLPIGEVEGFDLGLFARHVPRAFNLSADHDKLALRSAPHDLFHFDFQHGPVPLEGRSEARLEASGGPANGIVQWLRLQLDSETDYENAPGQGRASHWPVVFHPLDAEIAPGTATVVHGWHDERRLLIWPGELG